MELGAGGENPATIPRSMSLPSKTSQMRTRIVSAMDLYTGIKDRNAHIGALVEKRHEADRARTQEWWTEVRKIKKEAQPGFKLPEDAYKGKMTADQEIMEKVDKAQRAIQAKDEEYENEINNMKDRQEERMQDMLRQRRKDLRDLEKRKAELAAQVAEKMEEGAGKMKEKSKEYWDWLDKTKAAVAARPGVAPVLKSEAKSIDEIVAERRAKMSKAEKERNREYKSWLESVSKPKFEMPATTVNTPEQREAIIKEAAKKGIDKMNASTTEYLNEVTRIKEKRHEEMMERVRARTKAEREYIQNRNAKLEALHQKAIGDKAARDARAAETQREIQEMKEKVHKKPLLIEQAYSFGRVFKKSADVG
eukprot:TRINITY_DN19976_c0_g1_i1.p1 TRINITY_DN19976_c0_g1~~TRINITY_DN19976_c0_g1_i1.p1  ORF type:complete len:378 (-),score=103.16 TRINITY_DN19976_c0_g1_i1:7-1098(-)